MYFTDEIYSRPRKNQYTQQNNRFHGATVKLSFPYRDSFFYVKYVTLEYLLKVSTYLLNYIFTVFPSSQFLFLWILFSLSFVSSDSFQMSRIVSAIQTRAKGNCRKLCKY